MKMLIASNLNISMSSNGYELISFKLVIMTITTKHYGLIDSEKVL